MERRHRNCWEGIPADLATIRRFEPGCRFGRNRRFGNRILLEDGYGGLTYCMGR
jgi:hypothetical protein